MNDWTEIQIKNIVLGYRPVTYGIVQPGPDIRPDGIPLIRGKDYSSGKVDIHDLYHVKPEVDLPYKRSKVLGGDILFSIAGYVGQVAFVPKSLDRANITQTTARISVDFNKFYSDYIFYYLVSDFTQSQVRKYAKGSAQEGLNLSDVEKIYIKFPDYTTQRKIAHILSTADAVIEKTQAAIAKYKAIKQGMLHDLFTRGIDIKTGKLRPKYEDAPELYKESKLGWIPKEWEEKQLSEIVERLSPVTYGIVQPGKFDPNGILLIRGQDYISGWAKEPEFFRVSESLHKQYIRSLTKSGDILMCIVGATYGAVAVVPDWIEEANITQTTARIRCNNRTYSPLFLEYYLKSEFDKYFINKYVKGSAQPGLNLGDVDKFAIQLPKDIKEQELIGERMKSIVNKIISEQTYLQKLQQIKSGLMADLLSGKKEVIVEEETAN